MSASVDGTGITINSVNFTNPTELTLNITLTPGASPGARTITVTNPDGQALASRAGILTILPADRPAIATLIADLNGDVLSLGGSATDPVGIVSQGRATILDDANNVLTTPAPFGVTLAQLRARVVFPSAP